MNILLPTDFSDNAKKALNYAIACFPKANFTLLHIINIRQAGSTMVVDINKELKKVNQPKMDDLIHDLSHEFPNVKLKGLIEIGLFTQTIIEVVDTIKADLIILGTKGSTGLKEILIGSNAAAAIKNVMTPMIIVPENRKNIAPEKILLASDFSSESQVIESNIIDVIRDYFDAQLDLLHVFHSHDNMDSIGYSALIEKKELDVFVEKSEKIEEAILNFAHEKNYDLITLVPKDRGIIKNLFHHSVTKNLSMHSDIPLFIWK